MRYTDLLMESAEAELLATLKAQYGELTFSQCYFQVSSYKGEVNVSWDLTFRRNSHSGAFRQYSGSISRANSIIREIATKYASIVVGKPEYCTSESAKQSDERNAENGYSSYSEYEQSLGGEVRLKPQEAMAQEPAPAKAPAKKKTPTVRAEKPVQTPVAPQAPAKVANEKSITVRAVNGILKDTPYRLKTGDATNTKVMVFTAGKYTGKLEAKMFGAWLKDKGVDVSLIAKVNTTVAAIK